MGPNHDQFESYQRVLEFHSGNDDEIVRVGLNRTMEVLEHVGDILHIEDQLEFESAHEGFEINRQYPHLRRG